MTSRKNLINKQKSTLQPATLERVSRLRLNKNLKPVEVALEDAPDSRIVRRLKKKLQRKMNHGRK